MSLSRGTIVGGAWTVQRAITGAPRLEAKATGHGAAARLTLIACPRPPSHDQLDRWETRLRPDGLDHAAYPALLGFGHDPALGALWIARVWSPFESIDSWRRSSPTLAVATLARSLRSLGDAIAAAHARGVAHGALDARRVLHTDPDGAAVEVLDLGLVALDIELGQGDVPEVSPAADVQAYAAIAAAMLDAPGLDDVPWRPAFRAWHRRVTAADAEPPAIGTAVAELAALLPAAPVLGVAVPAAPPEERLDVELVGGAPVRATATPPLTAAPAQRGPGPAPAVVASPATIAAGDWPTLLSGALAAYPEPRDPVTGRIALVGAAVEVSIDATAGAVTTGPIRWLLGAGQRLAAAEAIAAGVARAVACVATGDGGGRLDVDAALRAAGLAPVARWPSDTDGWLDASTRAPGDERWWYGPGTRVVATADRLRVQYELDGWPHPHRRGTVGHDAAAVDLDDLRVVAGAGRALIEALRDVVGHVADRPVVIHTCRFCGRTSPAVEFHADLGACHRCSETELRVVH